ncbi:MAG: penicillin-binding transpeptidase domain-containing protein [Smithella sp.]
MKAIFIKFLLIILTATAVGYGMVQGAVMIASKTQHQEITPSVDKSVNKIELLNKNQSGNLLSCLDGKSFLNIREPAFTTQIEGRMYRVETSIDPRLQESLLAKVKEMMAKERYTSRCVGIVVMSADTGRVLSMVSFDKQNPTHNTCVNDQFPAASIFKIITAAAAIDTHGLNSNSLISYNGQKHTLYRGQLKETIKRYTHTISLEDSFAQSINPVFGKIGVELLGKKKIEDYAVRFGFNKPIDFDILVKPSYIAVDEEPYNQAEIASGFNTQTTISPLHGAMIVTTVLNEGKMKTPTIVDRIIGPQNQIVYERADHPAQKVISERASKELYRMMQATISSGTAQKLFKGHDRNAVLKVLHIGGKTGSINNNPRFDWFVGFAQNPRTRHAIAVSAVVVHEQFIGERAGEYAKLAMETFFSKELAMTVPVDHSPRG